MTDWLWWAIAAVVLAAIEILSLDLVFIMLSAGAVAGAVAAALGAPVVWQVVAAAVVALLMLVVVRPVALHHLRTPGGRTGVEALLGRTATVLERVDRHDGRVKIGGEVWSARTATGQDVFDAGQVVTVQRIEGATAVVAARDARPVPPAPEGEQP